MSTSLLKPLFLSGGGPIAAADITDAGAAFPAFAQAETVEAQRKALNDGLPATWNQRYSFSALEKRMMTMESAAGGTVAVAGFGDSMCSALGAKLFPLLYEKFGKGGLSTNRMGGELTGLASDLLTETLDSAVEVASTMHPGLIRTQISNGGSVTAIPNTALDFKKGWTKAVFIYETAPGAGSITLTLSQGGATIKTETIDTNAAASLQVWEVTTADGLLAGDRPTLTASASGTCYFNGAVLLCGSGILPINFGRGSSSYAQQNAVPDASLETLNAAFNFGLMFHVAKEEDATGAETASHLTKCLAAFPLTSHLLIGQSPRPVTGDEAMSFMLRGKAADNDLAFFDAYQLGVSYSNILALGWQSDSIHLYGSFQQYLAQTLMDGIGPFNRAFGTMRVWREVSSNLFWDAVTISEVPVTTPAYAAVTGSGARTRVSDGKWNSLTAIGSAGTSAVQLVYSQAAGGRIAYLSNSFVLVIPQTRVVFEAGCTVAVWVGGGSANTSPNKAEINMGYELAYPQDVGLTGGPAYMASRVWAYDGTTLFQSAWSRDSLANINSIGCTYCLKWDVGTLTLSLFQISGNAGTLAYMSCLSVPTMSGKTLAGASSGVKISNASTGAGAWYQQGLAKLVNYPTTTSIDPR